MKTHQNIAAISLLILFGCFIHAAYINWNFDDSYIVYRIVDNILSGRGWVYNIGENYNASTSVLNTVIVSLLAIIVGDIPWSAHLLGSVSMTLCAVILYDLIRKDYGIPLALAAGLLGLAVLADNKTWGLETHLFAALVLGFTWLERKKLNSWYLLGLVFLARPDGILLFAMKTVVEIYRNRALPIRGPLQSLVIVLPWLIFSIWQFEQLVPATLTNKMWQGQSGFWGQGAVYFAGLINHLAAKEIWLWPSLVFAIVGARRLIQIKDPLCYLLTLVLLQQLIYIVINVPAYHWYFSLLDLTLLILAVYGFINTFNFVTVRLPQRIIAEYAALVTVAFISIPPVAEIYRRDYFDSRDLAYQKLSEEIDRLNIGEGSLAALEVGTLGYYQDRKIIDLVSLTTSNPEFLTARNLGEFFDLAPRIVVLHDPIWATEQSLFQDYRFNALYLRQSRVSASVPTQIFIRKADMEEEIEELLREAENEFTLTTAVFTGFSDSQRCRLDLIDHRTIASSENHQWGEEIGSLAFAGWMYDSGTSSQTPISLAFIDEDDSIKLFSTFPVARPDVATAFENESYTDSGFSQAVRRSLLEQGIYRIGAYHQQTQKLCDLRASLEITP